MIRVTFIYREFRKTGFSIEGIFDVVRDCLKGRVEDGEYYLNPARSRFQNVLDIGSLPATIHHITGDINFLALGLKGKKIIITVHDLAHYEYLKKNPLKFWTYHFFWWYFPLRKATVITVVSEFTKQNLIQKFRFTKDKIRIIYNPIKPIFRFSERLTINTQPVILQIGTGANKNLNNLIEAVKGANYHLDIVAQEDEKCIEKLKQYGISYSIRSGLTDEELYQAYVNCDVVFFASFHEGFGMPIVEAQAIGRPVITSNLGAMLEIGKGSAVVVDPHSVSGIRKAIDNLVANKQYYDEVVQSGLANASQYSAQKIANDYFEIYQELDKTQP